MDECETTNRPDPSRSGAGDGPTEARARKRARGGGQAAAAGYDAYIGSAAWRDSPARLSELHASGRRCRICARGEPSVSLEVHHNTYERVGREWASDLCTVCTCCHALVTCELRRRRYEGSALPAPRPAARLLPGRTLFDGLSAGEGRSDDR